MSDQQKVARGHAQVHLSCGKFFLKRGGPPDAPRALMLDES